MTLRLALIVDSDAFGGAEVYARQLLRRAPAGIDPVVLAAPAVSTRLRGPWPLVEIPLTRRAGQAPDLERALRRLDPDVVHVNLVDPASNEAALRAGTAVAPTTVTLHLQGDLGADAQRLRDAFRPVEAALASSRTIAEQLRDDLEVPSRRVHRVRNGVDVPAHVVTRPPLAHRRLVVGAVGRLTEQKGFDLLIEAVRRVDPGGRLVDVVVAGAGRDADALRRQALGLPIRFAGHTDDVPALLRSIDVFCLPSRREALSLALLEALAAGLPCLTTAVGDTVDAVGDAALVVPPDDVEALTDGLTRLVRDGTLRRELGQRARSRAVRDFDAARMVRETMTVLQHAAQGRPAA